ncbi:MAG: RHS repeat-associated core domain-containing protein [Anaerolineales bacterium]|nr:RHS repeat-associated core domain-containing protein [Anaerolineales bacterium]
MVDGTATAYLQDLAGGLPVVVVETTAGIPTRYVYGLDLLVQLDSGDVPAFYHADGLGSTRAMSDLAGQGAATYTYDAFGTLRSQMGGAESAFTFSGEQVDPEAGLVFLRARYYDPAVGRFISRDYWRGVARAPQTHNRYVYVSKSPTNQVDPAGLFTRDQFISVLVTAYNFYNDITGSGEEIIDAVVEVGGAVYDYLSYANDLEAIANTPSSDEFVDYAYEHGATRELEQQYGSGTIESFGRIEYEHRETAKRAVVGFDRAFGTADRTGMYTLLKLLFGVDLQLDTPIQRGVTQLDDTDMAEPGRPIDIYAHIGDLRREPRPQPPSSTFGDLLKPQSTAIRQAATSSCSHTGGNLAPFGNCCGYALAVQLLDIYAQLDFASNRYPSFGAGAASLGTPA